MTTCELCLYRGESLGRIDGLYEIINCTHPVPFYQKINPIPYKDFQGKIVEHNCTCFKKSELCPKCRNVMEAVETFGCSLRGYKH